MATPAGPTGSIMEQLISTMGGYTGPTGQTMAQLVSTIRGSTGTYTPYVPLTPEQIIANAKAAESADLKLLTPFKTPNMTELNASLTAWANDGSLPVYVILSIKLAPPSTCSDGVVRGLYDYISWLIGVDVSAQTQTISENFPGKDISYSVSGVALRLHVSTEQQ